MGDERLVVNPGGGTFRDVNLEGGGGQAEAVDEVGTGERIMISSITKSIILSCS